MLGMFGRKAIKERPKLSGYKEEIMFVGLIIILFSWFIEMPLWLSITATVLASLRIIAKSIAFVIRVSNEAD